jgi:hypothetical protein
VTTVWAAGPDHPGTLNLPPVELQRVSAWLVSHGLDPQLVRNVAVLISDRTAVVAAEIMVPLPDGSHGVHQRQVDMRYPPPVPWTAP